MIIIIIIIIIIMMIIISSSGSNVIWKPAGQGVRKELKAPRRVPGALSRGLPSQPKIAATEATETGYSLQGGCSGRGVQWMGVVYSNKKVYNSIQITTPCFHCIPL